MFFKYMKNLFSKNFKQIIDGNIEKEKNYIKGIDMRFNENL